MTENETKLVRELDCKCPNRVNCPKVQEFADGSLVIRDDDLGAKPIAFDPEQAAKLRAFLAGKKG